MQQNKGKREIVIVLNVPTVLAIFALVLVAGWAEGYRRRGDFQVLEAQNARIIQLLEGAEITNNREATWSNKATLYKWV